jgi:oligo-1,6-glucosidase
MTNIGFDTVEDYRDINTLTKFRAAKKRREDVGALLENEKRASRDNARTPMQWDTTEYAGFSESPPWLRVNENYRSGISVSSQESDKDSVLNYFRRMIQIRKEHPCLIYGKYDLLLKDNEQVYAYTRTFQNESYLILLSFSTKIVTINIPLEYNEIRLLISNDEDRAESIKKDRDFALEPYQSLVYKVR